VAYPESFHGDFIRWDMVVICIWCALFVTSQFDVMFPIQCFGEVVDIICIFFYTRPAQLRKLEGPNIQHQFATSRKSLFHLDVEIWL